jgi:hypothetical protein
VVREAEIRRQEPVPTSEGFAPANREASNSPLLSAS